jgi:hypothetical protein
MQLYLIEMPDARHAHVSLAIIWLDIKISHHQLERSKCWSIPIEIIAIGICFLLKIGMTFAVKDSWLLTLITVKTVFLYFRVGYSFDYVYITATAY